MNWIYEVKKYYEGRPYHNWNHVKQCLRDLETITQPFNIKAVKTALVFHDAIYDIIRKDNEEESAILAKQYLEEKGEQEEFVQKVYELIIATRHVGVPSNFDEAVIRDVDLVNLGGQYTEFRRIGDGIRNEYFVYTDEEFNKGRIKFLEKFLDKPKIYFTKEFSDKFETQARLNLMRESNDRQLET